MVAEVLDKLLISGEVVTGWLRPYQPVKLLLSPLIDFWPFDASQGDGNPLYEGG